MKNPPGIPSSDETRVKFLLLVNRTAYRARFVTSGAIHVADPGGWEMSIEEENIVFSFPEGRVLDSQNRAFVTDMLSVRPVRLAIPFEYPVSVSSLGALPRYYLEFPRACSLTFEPARL